MQFTTVTCIENQSDNINTLARGQNTFLGIGHETVRNIKTRKNVKTVNVRVRTTR